MKTYLFAAMIVSLAPIQLSGCPNGSLVVLTTVQPDGAPPADGSQPPTDGSLPPFRPGDSYFVTARAVLDPQGQPQDDDARDFNAVLTQASRDASGVAEVGMFCGLSKNERTSATEAPVFKPGFTYRLEMTLTGILNGPAIDAGTGTEASTDATLPPPDGQVQGTQPPAAA